MTTALLALMLFALILIDYRLNKVKGILEELLKVQKKALHVELLREEREE